MTPKFDVVLDQCLENGIRMGWNRAHKHNDNPDQEMIIQNIHNSIVEELYSWFDFPNPYDHQAND